MSKRKVRLPAVEIASKRLRALLKRRFTLGLSFWVTVSLVVSAAAWIFASLEVFQLILLILSEAAVAIAVIAGRRYLLKLRIFRVFSDTIGPTDAAGIIKELSELRRPTITALIASVLFVVGLLIWTSGDFGRVWILIMCLGIYIGLLFSVRFSGISAPEFLELTRKAKESGFKIALFRPFSTQASTLARNALVPILAGYGTVHIVMDPTLEESESKGILGRTYKNLQDLAIVHYYSNEEWQPAVEEIIKNTDMAVIDLSSPRKGITWEIVKCYDYLPPHRIYGALDVSPFKDKGSINVLMQNLYYQIQKQKDANFPSNVRPYLFTFWSSLFYQLDIARDVHRKMCELIAFEVGAVDQSEYNAKYFGKLSDQEKSRYAVNRPDSESPHEALTTDPERVHEALAALQPGALNRILGLTQLKGAHFSTGRISCTNTNCGCLIFLVILLLLLIWFVL